MIPVHLIPLKWQRRSLQLFDAELFVAWIEQMLRVVAARGRFDGVEDCRQVEALFRKVQDAFRMMAEAPYSQNR